MPEDEEGILTDLFHPTVAGKSDGMPRKISKRLTGNDLSTISVLFDQGNKVSRHVCNGERGVLCSQLAHTHGNTLFSIPFSNSVFLLRLPHIIGLFGRG